MDTDDAQFAKKTLELIAFREPRFAISQLYKTLSEGDIVVTEDRIMEQCGSLIKKSEDGLYFEFVHYNVKEFMLSKELKDLPLVRYSLG